MSVGLQTRLGRGVRRAVLLGVTLGPTYHPVLAAQPAVATAAPPTTARTSPAEPFAFADFTWLNGTARQSTAVLDSK